MSTTLHEALAALGWTSTESKRFQKRDVFDEDGALVGSFTAGEADADTCDDCDAHRAAVKRLDARERYLDGAADYAMDAAKDVRP